MSLIVISLLLFVPFVPSEANTFKNPHFAPGHDAVVHLFEWKWHDIATECEQFLGPKGFGGIQVSPVQENAVIGSRPWWERYQPVSYKLITRSGNEEEFKDMVRRCNNVGVRIYVDAVFNHMSATKTPIKGTGGSTADTRYYPAVSYHSENFHEPCEITNYDDSDNVRYCELVGLQDLDQRQEYVRGKIVDFLNGLIDAGVAGFRIDAAKHMFPNDLEVIYSRLHTLNTNHGFPPGSHPYIYQEVPGYADGEGVKKNEYTSMAAVTEFKYGNELSNAMRGNNDLRWLINWGEAWGMIQSQDAIIFIDNHDTQRQNSNPPLTFKQSKQYKMAVALMLAHTYGNPKLMSSFDFTSFDQSPPADFNHNIISPLIRTDNTCGNGWVCEHRWRQIYNMVGFRNAVHGTTVTNWWDNQKNQIAFCRGNKGFIAINNDHGDLDQMLQTCLPAGTYCDVITGSLEGGKCTGKAVHVDEHGNARIQIAKWEEDGVLAIHHGVKV